MVFHIMLNYREQKKYNIMKIKYYNWYWIIQEKIKFADILINLSYNLTHWKIKRQSS